MKHLALGRPWVEADGVLADWFALHGAQAALVRPDHYVYGTAADGAALQALLNGLQSLLR